MRGVTSGGMSTWRQRPSAEALEAVVAMMPTAEAEAAARAAPTMGAPGPNIAAMPALPVRRLSWSSF